MTDREVYKICLAAMIVDKDLACEVIENASGPLSDDIDAIRQLMGLAYSPAQIREMEAEHFPLNCHALRMV